ncbi:MAG: dephospho-CoA kinase [Thermoleophilia bacterium]|nr:dephospho-CoA kinase [Thermoleophilia bacterium]
MSQKRLDIVAVGLTGGIGAGKSTALALFSEMGAVTMSADALVHELYKQPGVVALITERFGPGVVDSYNHVDRSRLAEAVRGRKRELRWLEKLTHPLVAEEIARRMNAAPDGSVVVCEVPLLFEAGFEALFDLIVTVEAGPEIRRRRSVQQFDLEQFTEFERLQASSKRRVEGSDLVFFNDGSLDDLRGFVRSAHERAVSLLKEEE